MMWSLLKKFVLGIITAAVIFVVVRHGLVEVGRSLIVRCVNNYHVPDEGIITVDEVEGEIFTYTPRENMKPLLRGAYFKSIRTPAPTILFFHGNGETIEPFLSSAAALSKSGYNVFLPEYQCYGGMGGRRPREAMMIEQGSHAYASLVSRPESTGAIIVVGRSLGTGIAAAVATEWDAPALILASPFRSITSVARRYAGLLAPLIVTDTFNTERRLEGFSQPLVIIHGTDDNVVPFSEGERLAAEQPAATFIPVSGVGHNDLPPLEEIFENIAPLLPEYVRPTPS